MKQLFLLLLLLLIGTGISQTDSLGISWNPNPEDDMLRYRLWRGINQDIMTLHDTIPHPTTNYIDGIGISPGNLYSFFLQAQDSSLLISENSDTVSVGIPVLTFNLDTLNSLFSHSYAKSSIGFDPDDPLDSLTFISQNEVNTIVSIIQDSIIISSNPVNYNGNGYFELGLYDPMGFWDLVNVSFFWSPDSEPSRPTGLMVINFPNPFTDETTIMYVVPREVDLTIKVIDTLGRTVKTLIENEKTLPGKHYIKFKIDTSGQYFYRLRTSDGDQLTGKATSF